MMVVQQPVSSDLTIATGLIGSETLTLSGCGTLANANVGTNKCCSLEHITPTRLPS